MWQNVLSQWLMCMWVEGVGFLKVWEWAWGLWRKGEKETSCASTKGVQIPGSRAREVPWGTLPHYWPCLGVVSFHHRCQSHPLLGSELMLVEGWVCQDIAKTWPHALPLSSFPQSLTRPVLFKHQIFSSTHFSDSKNALSTSAGLHCETHDGMWFM